MSTQIQHHFDNSTEFEDTLSSAQANTKAGKEMEFLQQLEERFATYDMHAYLSEAQYLWLRRLAREEE